MIYPRLAIEYGGVQAFEEFVLARYFMFVQVYFHKTRRYLDIMLVEVLKNILPNGCYPNKIKEYLALDDCKIIQLAIDNSDKVRACFYLTRRIICPAIYETKTHPQEGDKRSYGLILKTLQKEIGCKNLILDQSAVPKEIPRRQTLDDEMAIIIVKESGSPSTISEESHIIKNLTEKINIERIYVYPEFKDQGLKIVEELLDGI